MKYLSLVCNLSLQGFPYGIEKKEKSETETLAVRLPHYKRSFLWHGEAGPRSANFICGWPDCRDRAVGPFGGHGSDDASAIDGTSLQAREQKIWRFPVHDSEFADVPHTTTKSRCENTQAPEALTTPNPILDSVDPEVKIQVSFIVGTDGRVHSPLILQSAGNHDIRAVLDTVRSWRYRPAMCNGVPTETEGKIQFSGR